MISTRSYPLVQETEQSIISSQEVHIWAMITGVCVDDSDFQLLMIQTFEIDDMEWNSGADLNLLRFAICSQFMLNDII